MIHLIYINICSYVHRYVRENAYVYILCGYSTAFLKVLVCIRSFSISIHLPLQVCCWMFSLETSTCIHGRSISANNLVLRCSIPTWINRRLFFFPFFFPSSFSLSVFFYFSFVLSFDLLLTKWPLRLRDLVLLKP